MSSGPYPSSDPTQQNPTAPMGDPGRPPQLWLRPGHALPKRTWQRSSRIPVFVISIVAGLFFAAVALLVLLGGCINASVFTAKGGIICPSQQTTSMAVGPGTPVVIYDETGDRLARTTLGVPTRVDGRCELPFSADSVVSGRGNYVVRVGDLYQETVSESALLRGAVLRPVP